jgi:hypothetical protein
MQSGSSIGDLGDLTPCNASPNPNALMSFQRDDTEECWRATVRSLLDQTPSNTLHMFHILHRVVKVSGFGCNFNRFLRVYIEVEVLLMIFSNLYVHIGYHKKMRVANSRSLRDPERVRGRRPSHDRMLCSEPRELQTSVDPSQLGHYSVDHARRPTARMVLTHRSKVGRCFAIPYASYT